MNILLVLLLLLVVVLAMGVSALHGLFHLAVFVCWVFGVVRSFQASLILGIISLLFAPLGLIVGVGSLITGRNVGNDIVNAFRR
ncbi:MAG TPA: hypothetical protein V6C81_18370 [Planktothrix sp.]|jgi:hypothetical protein